MNLRPFLPPQTGLVGNGCYVLDGCNTVQIERKRLGLEFLPLNQPAIQAEMAGRYGQPFGTQKIWRTLRDRGELGTGAAWAQIPDTRTWATIAYGQRPFDEAIKAALGAGHAVSWQLPITAGVMDSALVRVPAPKVGEARPYAHAMTILDFPDGDYFPCAGTTSFDADGWKDHGVAWMHKNWLMEMMVGTLGTLSYITDLGIAVPSQQPTGNTVTFDQVIAALKQQWSPAEIQAFRDALAVPITTPPPSVPPATTGLSPEGTKVNTTGGTITDGAGTWELHGSPGADGKFFVWHNGRPTSPRLYTLSLAIKNGRAWYDQGGIYTGPVDPAW